ncbi:MAG: glycosyltransferase 87 family protein [Capsulimonadaceae bacterium]|nr:glycosyltransferase 87 family protein [Capsulimonadaceae bacterium]
MDRSSKIALMEVIILCGFICAVSFHYVAGVAKHGEYPYSTFLYRPDLQFSDFTETVFHSSTPHAKLENAAYSSGPAYGPFLLAVVGALFQHKGLHVHTALVWFLGTFAVAYFVICYKYLKTDCCSETIRRCVIFSFCSYSFLYALDRANFEVWSVLAVAAAFGAYSARGSFSKVKPWLAMTSMALALSFKPFGIFFLPAFMAQRTKRETAITIIMAVLLTLCGLVYLGPHIGTTLHDMLNNIEATNQRYVIGKDGMVNGSGLYPMLKLSCRWYYGNYHASWVEPLHFYFCISAVISIICLFLYVLLIEREAWRQFAICALAVNLLPTIAFPYRLLYVNIAMMAFANAAVKNKNDRLYSILFAVVVMPLGYLFFDPVELSETTLIEPLAMIALTAMIVWDGYAARRAALAAAPADTPVQASFPSPFAGTPAYSTGALREQPLEQSRAAMEHKSGLPLTAESDNAG